MIGNLATWFLGTASWKTVLLSLGAAAGTVAVLNTVATPRVVDASGGTDPFDLMWPLSADTLLQGLQTYNPEAVSAYLLFSAIDIPFPIFAGLFQILLWCWLINAADKDWLLDQARKGWILLAWLPTLFDLTENVGFVTLVLDPPQTKSALIDFTVFVHACKMHSIDVVFAVSVVLAVIALWSLMHRSSGSEPTND